MERWSYNNPDIAAARVAFVRETKIANDQELFEKLVKRTDRFFSVQVAWKRPNSDLIGPYIQFLVLTDRFEDAEAALAKYDYLLKNPAMLLAQADLKAAKGDLEGAQKLLKEAGALAKRSPSQSNIRCKAHPTIHGFSTVVPQTRR